MSATVVEFRLTLAEFRLTHPPEVVLQSLADGLIERLDCVEPKCILSLGFVSQSTKVDAAMTIPSTISTRPTAALVKGHARDLVAKDPSRISTDLEAACDTRRGMPRASSTCYIVAVLASSSVSVAERQVRIVVAPPPPPAAEPRSTDKSTYVVVIVLLVVGMLAALGVLVHQRMLVPRRARPWPGDGAALLGANSARGLPREIEAQCVGMQLTASAEDKTAFRQV